MPRKSLPLPLLCLTVSTALPDLNSACFKLNLYSFLQDSLGTHPTSCCFPKSLFDFAQCLCKYTHTRGFFPLIVKLGISKLQVSLKKRQQRLAKLSNRPQILASPPESSSCLDSIEGVTKGGFLGSSLALRRDRSLGLNASMGKGRTVGRT